jgi:hypothetical protein
VLDCSKKGWGPVLVEAIVAIAVAIAAEMAPKRKRKRS